MPDLQTTIIGIIVAVVVIWAIVLIPWRRKSPATSSADVLRDWIATGRVNMVAAKETNGDDMPTDFMVVIEENRLVADISGRGNVEIRWRKPTRHEARTIVRFYQDFMNKSFVPHESLQRSPFGAARVSAPSAEATDYRPQPQPEGTQ